MLIETILRAKGGEVFTVTADATLRAAAAILDEKRIGAIVAVDAETGSVVGVLSERDIVRRLVQHGAACLEITVAEAMTRNVISIGPKETMHDGLERMTDRRIRHLPVCEGDRLIGLVSIGDLVKWKIVETEAEAAALKSYVAG